MGWIGQIKWRIHFKITKTSYKKCKIWTSHANSSLVFVNMASLDLVQIGLFLSFDHILLRFLLYQENNFMLLLDSGNKISCHLWNIFFSDIFYIGRSNYDLTKIGILFEKSDISLLLFYPFFTLKKGAMVYWSMTL